jgi:FMN-dependent oxidoreductase (nitrilotriacetate monooxygenase family)
LAIVLVAAAANDGPRRIADFPGDVMERRGLVNRADHAIWAAFLWPGGHHHAAWRLPYSVGDDMHSFENYRRMAQAAERAKLDVVFLGDLLAVWPLPWEHLAQTARAARLEPLTLAAALSQVTDEIGIVATASTSFTEPFNVARQFGSLDHLTGGRMGWNVVTTFTDDSAKNFGMDQLPPRTERYERAQEFLDLVKGLWDSYEDDAVLRDKVSGQFFDPAKLHRVDHEGHHFKVLGPLNMERPPQGYPVICQAGASAEGTAFAAANGELLFTIASSLERAQEYYQRIKAAASDAGRDPDGVKVLVGLNPVLGRTQSEAQEKYDEMQSLLDENVTRVLAEHYFGVDLSQYELDEPVPEIELPEVGNSMPRAHQEFMLNKARDEGLTMRQLVNGFNGLNIYPASAEAAADQFEEYFRKDGCDGFILQISHVPEGVDDFVELVAPLLRERGLLRSEYPGHTLREKLGLPRPQNQFAGSPVSAA